MQWVYIEFTALTLDFACTQARDTAQPVIVYNTKRNQVAQLNPAARELGITPGTGMAQAAALCANLTIIPLDISKQGDYLQSLATHVYEVASDIVLFAPQALAIRLDNLRQYYGSSVAAWQAIDAILQAQQVVFRYADGWSPLTAKLLANAGTNRLLGNHQAIRAALHDCPLSLTDLSDKDISLFNRLGVHQVGQVLALPVSELGKRFANNALIYLNELRGACFPKVRYFQPQEDCRLHIEPAYEIADAQRCKPYLTRLLKDLCVFLRVRNLMTARIRVTTHYREADSDAFTIASATPITRYTDWLRLAEVWLETLSLAAPLTGLSLTCDELENVEADNQDFFTDRYQYFANQQLLSRLRTRLGTTAVWQPFADNDHRMHRQTAAQDTGTENVVDETCPAFSLTTPLPNTLEGSVTFGPVRLQTGWWDEAAVKRDYFILKRANGAFHQVYRDARQRWFVHGYYS